MSEPQIRAREDGPSKPQLWPIFICYRQSDGLAAARRLHELLDKHETDGPNGEQIRLDVYLDQAMAAVADWRELHKPYLEKARALLVVCSPGAKIDEGPDDWVHKEIRWWLRHRDVAPILIDPLRQGLRYVPNEISERWPEIQRVPLVSSEWVNLPSAELEERSNALRRVILGAIVPSGKAIWQQELEEEARRRAAQLRRALVAAVGLLVFAGASFIQQNRVETKERLARRAASKARIALAAEALKENRSADALAHLAYALRRDPGWKALRAFTVNLLQNYPLPRVVRSPDGKIYDHAFGSEGPRMVTASAGGTAQLWNLWNGKAIGAPLGVGGEVFDARISGQWVLTVSRDHTVQVWEASSGRPAGVRVRPEVAVLKVKFLPGDNSQPRVGTEYPGGWRQFWNMSTGKPEGPPRRGGLYSGWVATEAWSPDARWKAKTPQRNFVQVGSVGIEDVLLPAMQHVQPVTAVDFSADGRWLLTRSDGNIERIWEAFRGKAVGAVDWKRVIGSATSNQATAVGPYRVNLTPEGRVQILEAASGALVVTLGSSEAASFRTAELGPDGKWVVTVSPDNSVRVWEAESGVPVSVAMEHREEVTRAAFSHDARWVVTTQADGTVRAWNTLITPEEEAALLAEVVEALGGVVATDTGLEHLTGWEQRLDDVRRRALLAPPNEPTVLSLARWLFSDPWERTVQPLSTTTVPEYICEALRNGAWNEADRYFPEHPLLRNGESGPLPVKCLEER